MTIVTVKGQKYKINPPNDPLIEQLGHYGKILFQLIREKSPDRYQQKKAKRKLITRIKTAEKMFGDQVMELIYSGLNQAEATEIVWPEVTAKFQLDK